MDGRTQHEELNFIVFEFHDSNNKNAYVYLLQITKPLSAEINIS